MELSLKQFRPRGLLYAKAEPLDESIIDDNFFNYQVMICAEVHLIIKFVNLNNFAPTGPCGQGLARLRVVVPLIFIDLHLYV